MGALVTSKMATINEKLGEATLKNKHFKKIVEMFYEDMGVENHDQLMAKMTKIGMKIAKKIHECPKMQKLFKEMCRLIQMAEKTKEIFDIHKKLTSRPGGMSTTSNHGCEFLAFLMLT